MKHFLLSSSLALLLALAAASCGGGEGELTLEGYFQRLVAIMVDQRARFEALDVELASRYGDTAEIARYQDFFQGALSIATDTNNALDDVVPPAQVEQPHGEFVAAERDVQTLLEEYAGQLAAARSLSDADNLTAAYDAKFAAINRDQANPAIDKLKGIADANNIDFALPSP